MPEPMDWKQTLGLAIPAALAGIGGGGVGVGSFGQGWARGRGVFDEMQQRERSLQLQQEAERWSQQRDLQADARYNTERQDAQRERYLKILQSLPELREQALEQAELAGALDPELAATHANQTMNEWLTAIRQLVPDAGVDTSLFDRMATVTPTHASRRLVARLLPEYEKLTQGLDEAALDRLRANPNPIGRWPFSFADVERMVGMTGHPAKKGYTPGSFEDYTYKKYGPSPTPDQILEARKVYQQIDDRPRVTVNLQGATPSTITTLDELEPKDAAVVKSLLEGRTPITTFRDRSGERSKWISLASQVDPNYSPLRYDTRKAFTDPNSKTSLNIRSLNTAIAHVKKLDELGKALNTRNVQGVNEFVNWARTQTGDPRVTNFQTAVTAVAGESANVFKNTGGTDQEIAKWQTAFSAAQSPQQIREVVQTLGELLRGRMQAVQWEWQRVFGQDKFYPMLAPQSRSALSSLAIPYKDLDPGDGLTPESARGSRQDLKNRLRGGR